MEYFKRAAALQKGAYAIGLILLLGLTLRVCFGAILVAMLGPGVALRGSSNAAVHGAIDAMRLEFDHLHHYLLASVHTHVDKS